LNKATIAPSSGLPGVQNIIDAEIPILIPHATCRPTLRLANMFDCLGLRFVDNEAGRSAKLHLCKFR